MLNLLACKFDATPTSTDISYFGHNFSHSNEAEYSIMSKIPSSWSKSWTPRYDNNF